MSCSPLTGNHQTKTWLLLAILVVLNSVPYALWSLDFVSGKHIATNSHFPINPDSSIACLVDSSLFFDKQTYFNGEIFMFMFKSKLFHLPDPFSGLVSSFFLVNSLCFDCRNRQVTTTLQTLPEVLHCDAWLEEEGGRARVRCVNGRKGWARVVGFKSCTKAFKIAINWDLMRFNQDKRRPSQQSGPIKCLSTSNNGFYMRFIIGGVSPLDFF